MRRRHVDWEKSARLAAAKLRMETASSPDDPDQRLIVFVAEPGSPSADALRILASWHLGTIASPPETSRR